MKVEFLVWLAAAEGGGGGGKERGRGSSNFSISSLTHPQNLGVIKKLLRKMPNVVFVTMLMLAVLGRNEICWSERGSKSHWNILLNPILLRFGLSPPPQVLNQRLEDAA